MIEPFAKSKPIPRAIFREMVGFLSSYAFTWLIGTGFGFDPIVELLSKITPASEETAREISKKIFGGSVALNAQVGRAFESIKDDWATLSRLLMVAQMARICRLSPEQAEAIYLNDTPAIQILVEEAQVSTDSLAKKIHCSKKEAQHLIDYYTNNQSLLYKILNGTVKSNILGIAAAFAVSYYLPVEGWSTLLQNLSRGVAGYGAARLTETVASKLLNQFFVCHKKPTQPVTINQEQQPLTMDAVNDEPPAHEQFAPTEEQLEHQQEINEEEGKGEEKEISITI